MKIIKNKNYTDHIKKIEIQIKKQEYDNIINKEKSELEKIKKATQKKTKQKKKEQKYQGIELKYVPKINEFIKEINNENYHFSKKIGFHEINLLDRQKIWNEAKKKKLEYLKKIYQKNE